MKGYKKFEVREKDSDNECYGIWNNDMLAFQYVDAWNGTETIFIHEAIEKCITLNNLIKL